MEWFEILCSVIGAGTLAWWVMRLVDKLEGGDRR